MKRSVNYSHLEGLESAVVSLPSKIGAIINKREQDLVCELVFAPDKRTHLPSSDISVYLSRNTPVQVREFIKSNIFGEGMERPSYSQDIDDSVIHELVRGSSETVDSYVSRVSAFMQNEKSKVTDAFVRARNIERSRKSNLV